MTALLVTAIVTVGVVLICITGIVAAVSRDIAVARATGVDPAEKRRAEKERKHLADLNGER